jgi:hypothetical protein
MRNEEVDHERLAPELERLVSSLTQTALEAHVSERDRLMFLCGQAAASATPKATGRQGAPYWLAATVVLLAFGLGGLAGHSLVHAPSDEERIAVEIVPAHPNFAQSQTGREPLATPSDYAESINSVRSGSSFYAAMDLAAIQAIPTDIPPSERALPETELLRAGMYQSLLNPSSSW